MKKVLFFICVLNVMAIFCGEKGAKKQKIEDQRQSQEKSNNPYDILLVACLKDTVSYQKLQVADEVEKTKKELATEKKSTAPVISQAAWNYHERTCKKFLVHGF